MTIYVQFDGSSWSTIFYHYFNYQLKKLLGRLNFIFLKRLKQVFCLGVEKGTYPDAINKNFFLNKRKKLGVLPFLNFFLIGQCLEMDQTHIMMAID